MALVKTFEEMWGWKRARFLCNLIYKITTRHSFYYDFALKDQIRRSAISIMANIAEGFERNSKLQKRFYMNIAIGSAGETRSHLHLAEDLNYITNEEHKYLANELKEISKIISRFIKDPESLTDNNESNQSTSVIPIPASLQ